MFTPAGVLLAHLLVTFPYMLGAVKPLLDELETTYEEAAYTIGASRWQTFWLRHPAGPARRPFQRHAPHVRAFPGRIRRHGPGLGQPPAADADGAALHLCPVRGRQHGRRQRGGGRAGGPVLRDLLFPAPLHSRREIAERT